MELDISTHDVFYYETFVEKYRKPKQKANDSEDNNIIDQQDLPADDAVIEEESELEEQNEPDEDMENESEEEYESVEL